MLFAYACHFCGPVEDRDEVWIQAVGAVGVSSLEEHDVRFGAAGEGCAEALRTGGRSGCARECGVCLCGILPEEAQERVWFRHGCVDCANARGCGVVMVESS